MNKLFYFLKECFVFLLKKRYRIFFNMINPFVGLLALFLVTKFFSDFYEIKDDFIKDFEGFSFKLKTYNAYDFFIKQTDVKALNQSQILKAISLHSMEINEKDLFNLVGASQKEGQKKEESPFFLAFNKEAYQELQRRLWMGDFSQFEGKEKSLFVGKILGEQMAQKRGISLEHLIGERVFLNESYFTIRGIFSNENILKTPLHKTFHFLFSELDPYTPLDKGVVMNENLFYEYFDKSLNEKKDFLHYRKVDIMQLIKKSEVLKESIEKEINSLFGENAKRLIKFDMEKGMDEIFMIVAVIVITIFCISMLFLIIGGFSISNLIYSLFMMRLYEVGIRLSLGFSKRWVIGQVFMETFLMTLGATLLATGVGSVIYGVGSLALFSEQLLWFHWGFAALLTLGVGLLFAGLTCFSVILFVLRMNIVDLLKGRI